MSAKDKEVTLDLSGATLQLDGEEYILESGELTVRVDYLYSADDAPDDPTMVQEHVSIQAETYNPEE